MWSTKVWDITSSTSDRYNFRSPATRTLTTADCLPEHRVRRLRRRRHALSSTSPADYAVTKSQKFHTSYIASDKVICKQPDDKASDKPDDD